jgi:hypothetical protein
LWNTNTEKNLNDEPAEKNILGMIIMQNIDVINNWQHIPEESRRLCVSHLRHKLSPYSINKLKQELTEKGHIAEQDYVFGMHVRMLLRNIVPDEKLPIVLQCDPNGVNPNGQNWNDFYLGALTDLVK